MKVNYVAKEDGWWAVGHPAKSKPVWHGPFGSKGQAVGFARLNLQGVDDAVDEDTSGALQNGSNRGKRGNVQRDDSVV